MKAAVLHKVGDDPSIVDVTPLEPGPRDVVVRVTASGLCRSDLSVMRGHIPGHLPIVLGHEGTGVVDYVGSEVAGLAVGDRVIGSFRPNCGVCWWCNHDQPYLCVGVGGYMQPRVAVDEGATATAFCGLGTYAEAFTAHEASVVRVRTDLPDEYLALIGCGVTTGIGAVFNTARVPAGASVVVVGCGGVGQAVIQAAGIAGAARIIAVDTTPMKRDVALTLGATHVIDPAEGDVPTQVAALTDDRGADFAFEVVGRASSVATAIDSVRGGGTAIVVGIITDDTITIGKSAFVSAKTVVGSLYGSAHVRRDFQRCIDLIESGRLDMSGMVTQRISLDQLNEGFRALEAGEVIRSVIV